MTVFSNLDSVISFSDFIRKYTEFWRESITIVINWILGFINIQIDITNAVIFFAVFSCFLVSLSSQQNSSRSWSKPFRIISFFIAGLFSATYFLFVALPGIANDPRLEEERLLYFAISFSLSLVLALPIYIREYPIKNKYFSFIGISGFFLVLILGSLTGFGEYLDTGTILRQSTEYLSFIALSTIVIAMYYNSEPIAISLRTLSITVIIGALIAMNQISLFAESI